MHARYLETAQKDPAEYIFKRSLYRNFVVCVRLTQIQQTN